MHLQFKNHKSAVHLWSLSCWQNVLVSYTCVCHRAYFLQWSEIQRNRSDANFLDGLQKYTNHSPLYCDTFKWGVKHSGFIGLETFSRFKEAKENQPNTVSRSLFTISSSNPRSCWYSRLPPWRSVFPNVRIHWCSFLLSSITEGKVYDGHLCLILNTLPFFDDNDKKKAH